MFLPVNISNRASFRSKGFEVSDALRVPKRWIGHGGREVGGRGEGGGSPFLKPTDYIWLIG